MKPHETQLKQNVCEGNHIIGEEVNGIITEVDQSTLRKIDLGRKLLQGLESDSNPHGYRILAFQAPQMWSRREACGIPGVPVVGSLPASPGFQPLV